MDGSTPRQSGLFANRPLTKLLVGEFISGIGDWLYVVAIFIVSYRESQDAALVGAIGYLNAAIGVGGLAGAIGAGGRFFCVRRRDDHDLSAARPG